MEERVKPWLQPHLDRRLRDPVGYRRDAQHPHAPGLLRNWHCLYRRRKIAAGTHPIPKLVQVRGELRLEPLDRLRVDPCGSMIGLHTQPGFPDQCLGNAVIPQNDRTVADNASWTPPLCPNDACWTGTAKAQYPVDAPAQLFEYTMISQNPANGGPFPDPNDKKGIPLVDIDLSYVDSLYLPIATNLDDDGATAYMGTTLDYKDFLGRAGNFLSIRGSYGNVMVEPIWSQYAAYAPENWSNNVFHDLAWSQNPTDNLHIVGKDIIGDLIPFPNPQPPTSVLYTPNYTGPRLCTAVQACSNLSGNCCPAADGKMLACCGAPLPYLIANTYWVGKSGWSIRRPTSSLGGGLNGRMRRLIRVTWTLRTP